ncbi:hypothetical protein BDN70DRAFT_800339 [Pholiota conissans]|uniref:Uncharacterized protein n=1 Tax=Pholiota conissans TaxID=109636 RepID=A0A9P5Z985_9AGAR|nr:hypothetical protein BDN70DRAFT_800339 [Pholiota conissans]
MVQIEKRLLWHPRHDNKFVVGGGSQIMLYEWAEEYPEIRHVTSQHDLHFMKCFAWSPDPAFDDLMAIGLSTGKVDLIRLEAGKQAQKKNVLSSGPSVTLPIRSARSCNVVTFNNVDPNYLAVGLDKVRGDSSLMIWDISTVTPSLTLPISNPTDPDTITTPQPRPQPLLPRLETQTRFDSRLLQQHAPAELVSSLAFLPSSTNLILAGLSHRWLRLFDLRSAAIPVVNVSSKVNGIATDPFDPHRVATFGDSTVTIWDARRLTHPILSFTERDAIADGARIKSGSSFVHIEFSSTRRGCVATLEKDSSYVRFWDLAESRAVTVEGSVTGGGSSDGETSRSRDSIRATKRSWAANLPWPTGGTQQTPSPRETLDNSTHRSFVVADTRRTKYFHRPLASFALVPKPKSPPSLTSKVMVVSKDGDLELYAIYDTSKQLAWSSKGGLTLGAGQGLKTIDGYKGSDTEDEFEAELAQQLGSAAPFKYRTSRERTRGSRSRSGPSREGSRVRGRGDSVVGSRIPPPLSGVPSLFGRGDDDGFPMLSGRPMGLSASRPGKTRTYSPASVRKYRSSERGEPNALQRRSLSRADMTPADEPVKASPPAQQTAVPPVERRTIDRPPQKAKEAKKRGIVRVVQEDISMIMRRRAKAGYGLSQPHLNVSVTHDVSSDSTAQILSDLWSWIQNSQEILCVPTPRLNGFDFSYHGLLGIWEGFAPIDGTAPGNLSDDTPLALQRSLLLDLPVPNVHHSRSGSTGGGNYGRSSRRSHSPVDDLQDNWSAALADLANRRGIDRWSWKSPVPTNKLVARQVALTVCGWSLREEEITANIKKWERDGKISKVACWLVFTGQFGKAADMLMKSDDETHQMMSGTIMALAPSPGHSGSQRGSDLRDHYSRLINRLHDPYFRVMLTHLAMGDWGEVLDEELIPFKERLIIAFLFLDDKTLTSYLQRSVKRACVEGGIDAIMVTGLTHTGMDIIQAYVDRTGDIQTAAILSSYVCPQKFKDRRAERWLEAYRDLLDGFKLHHLRVGFDIERGQLLQGGMHTGDMLPEEWAPRQILIRCHYCSKPVRNIGALLSTQQKWRPTACENCNRELPRCSVCLLTLSIVHDAAREVDLGWIRLLADFFFGLDTFDDAIVICQTCRHGGHAAHILEWFEGEEPGRRHDICPVSDCDCRCAEEF